MTTPTDRIERALGRRPALLSRLSGGCIAEVYRAEFAGGDAVVAKIDAGPAPTLDREAFMLRYLADHSRLPVPRVLAAEPGVLVLEFVESSGGISGSAERHAAELLAELHGIAPPAPNERRFGFERDTLIGPLDQPNPWTGSWIEFFREQRLGVMTERACRAGRLGASAAARLGRLGARLGELIDEPARPGLIHGDVWSGNVLCDGGRVAAFIDPALAYAHPEQELAFTTLFGTFGRPFFERYAELRPISPGFDAGPRPRRDVYNLYPLLVHTVLFGGHYALELEASLGRLGF